MIDSTLTTGLAADNQVKRVDFVRLRSELKSLVLALMKENGTIAVAEFEVCLKLLKRLQRVCDTKTPTTMLHTR